MKHTNPSELIKIIEKYIKSKEEYALLIDGEWGSGKTHFERYVLEPHLNKLKEENILKTDYVYISLYGITSKDEIDRIIVNEILSKTDEKLGKLLSLAHKGSNILGDIIKAAVPEKVGNALENINLESIIQNVAYFENKILIFDDLERCQLDVNSIFSYINEYIEDKGCKCIIFVNQEEFSTNNLMKNIELKYLVAKPLNKEFISQKEKNNKSLEEIFGLIKKEKNTASDKNQIISKEDLDSKVKELFSEDLEYKKIKEKVIGQEIKFVPDIEEVIKTLSSDIANPIAKKILLKNAYSISRIMSEKKHNNIRTLKFVIAKFLEIVSGLNRSKLKQDEDYERILEDILEYIVYTTIDKKKEDKTKKWISTEKYHIENNYSEFKFVDELLELGYIDTKDMIKTLKEYSKQIKSEIESNPNDPVKKLKDRYFFMEDEEIKKLLKEIFRKLKDNSYEIFSYNKIVRILLLVKTLGFGDDTLDMNLFIAIMIKNIRKAPNNAFLEMGTFVEENIKTDYDKYIKQLNSYLSNAKRIKRINFINEVIKNEEGWARILNEFLNEMKFNEKSDIFGEINIDNLIDVLNDSKVLDIRNFRECIFRRYIEVENIDRVKELKLLRKIYQLLEDII